MTTQIEPHAICRDFPNDYVSAPETMQLEQSRLFVWGGSTIHWGGWALRFKPEDFRLKSAVGQEIDWPFDYDEIEPFYHQAEQTLTIAGDSGNDDPPRRRKRYPLEAPTYCQPDGLVIRALEKMKISYAHLPIARNGDCQTTGTCKYCPVGGRFSADMILDELEADKRFEMRLHSAVRRIVMRDKKLAAGVEFVSTTTGEINSAEADFVVLCAGAIETPKLLLASAEGRYWPNGVGNDSGHVGKHFKTHQRITTSAVLESNIDRVQQELDFPTLCSRHFDSPEEQRDGKMFFVRADTPNIAIERLIAAGRTVTEIELATRGPAKFELQGFVEQFSTPGNAIDLASGTTRFKIPRTKVTYKQSGTEKAAIEKHLKRFESILQTLGAKSFSSVMLVPRADHTASTCRMSVSDADGVTDGDLKVHGTDNLFICSNAVMPTLAAVNPTLTLVALAHRFVGRLA